MSDKIRHISIDLKDGRVETGPVYFNDDWPGVFIRGDNAAGFALALEYILNDDKELWKSKVLQLIELLKSCQI